MSKSFSLMLGFFFLKAAVFLKVLVN